MQKNKVLISTFKRMEYQTWVFFKILCLVLIPPFVVLYFICGLHFPEAAIISAFPGSLIMIALYSWFFTEYEKSEKELGK